MKSNSWDNEGVFYPDVVKCNVNGRNVRRRVLCFALLIGGRHVVAASPNFQRSEAYHNARKAAAGALPLPHTDRVEDTLTVALRLRGFPVSSCEFSIGDRTAQYLQEEFSV